jgi:hypothetical protein
MSSARLRDEQTNEGQTNDGQSIHLTRLVAFLFRGVSVDGTAQLHDSDER